MFSLIQPSPQIILSLVFVSSSRSWYLSLTHFISLCSPPPVKKKKKSLIKCQNTHRAGEQIVNAFIKQIHFSSSLRMEINYPPGTATRRCTVAGSGSFRRGWSSFHPAGEFPSPRLGGGRAQQGSEKGQKRADGGGFIGRGARSLWLVASSRSFPLRASHCWGCRRTGFLLAL